MPSKEFKGVLIAKFTTPAARDQAIYALRASLHKPGEETIWAKEDLPVHVSARKAFLNSLRYQLNKWGFVYDEMNIDAEYTTLKVGSKTVLKLTITEGKLHFDWCQDWAEWDELRSSTELATLLAKAASDLSKSGKGKGKSKYIDQLRYSDPLTKNDPWSKAGGKR